MFKRSHSLATLGAFAGVAILAGVIGAGTAGAAADPVANPDYATLAPGAAVSIDVLANDTPGYGYALSPSSLQIVSAPSLGWAGTDPINHLVTYQAPANQTGVTSFTYLVCDTSTVCATGTVYVTITNGATPGTGIPPTAGSPTIVADYYSGGYSLYYPDGTTVPIANTTSAPPPATTTSYVNGYGTNLAVCTPTLANLPAFGQYVYTYANGASVGATHGTPTAVYDQWSGQYMLYYGDGLVLPGAVFGANGGRFVTTGYAKYPTYASDARPTLIYDPAIGYVLVRQDGSVVSTLAPNTTPVTVYSSTLGGNVLVFPSGVVVPIAGQGQATTFNTGITAQVVITGPDMWTGIPAYTISYGATAGGACVVPAATSA